MTVRWTVAHVRGIALTAVVVSMFAGVMAGCGSGSTGTPVASAQPTPGMSGNVAAAKAAVAAALKGLDTSPPVSGPRAVKGKNIWVVVCSETAAGCAQAGEAVKTAGTAIGWHVTVADGKLDPNTESAQIRAAVAAKANAIVLVAVDCVSARGALQQARSAGVKIYGLAASDCNAKYSGTGAPLFDASLKFAGGRDIQGFVAWTGTLIGDYIIATTDGKANVIQPYETDVIEPRELSDAAYSTLKACGGCQVHRFDFTGADLVGGALQSKTAAALVRYPTANVVQAPYDAAILLGLGPASRAAGRPIILTGAEGVGPNVALIENGRQAMAAGWSYEWMGWGAVDGLNRLFAGKPQVDEGIGLQLLDKASPTRHLPDFQAAYEKIWLG
jgi:ribose transport system substrate-binding protein